MIQRVLIVGAGAMGTGIAQVCAQSGCRVAQVDTAQRFLDASKAQMDKQLGRLLQKGKITKARKDEIMGNIAYSTNLADGADADLMIEAVTEDLAIKKGVFQAADKLLNPRAVLATNTSTLSIAAIGGATQRPDQCIGLHFFIPAPVMKLLEIIPSIATSQETLAAMKAFSAQIGKTCIVANDYPGFIVNHILNPMINQAMFLVMEGNKPEDIDAGMKLGANMPMGPLELADFMGLDVFLAVMNALYDGFKDPKYRPCPLVVKLVEAGRLGRKTGRGFYEYGQS